MRNEKQIVCLKYKIKAYLTDKPKNQNLTFEPTHASALWSNTTKLEAWKGKDADRSLASIVYAPHGNHSQQKPLFLEVFLRLNLTSHLHP